MPHEIILDAKNPVSPVSVDPSHTAVLLLDYHTFLFGRVPAEAGPTVIAAAQTLRQWALDNKALVVHGLIDVFGPILSTYKGKDRATGMQQMLSSQENSSSMTGEHPDIAAPGSDTSQRGKDVVTISENEVVVKRTLGQISALKSEGLSELFKERGIRSLVIGGLSTSGCVAATARPASDEGFIVTVIEDACADPKPGVHDMVLDDVLNSQVHICTAKQWTGAW